MKSMGLNIGGGKTRLEGSINVDILGGDVRGDVTRLPFRDGSFPIVFAFHVLEHIPDLRAAMHEIHRVAKDDAYVFVRVPYGLDALYDPYHFHPFDLSTLDRFAHVDSNSLQYDRLFRIILSSISDYHIPLGLEWHFLHSPRLPFRLLRRFFKRRPDDGRVINPFPLWRRKELSCLMVAVK